MKILTALLTLLCCVSGIAQDDLNPAVLLVSDNIQQDNILAGAAGKDVLVIRYKTKTTDLNGLLSLVSKKLDGKLASSIGIAAHDYGEAKFYLTDSETISLQSTLNNLKQREFWKELGQLIAENGRIDLLVCNLARGNQGEMLIASLENLTKVQVAASSNETGNPLKGGDWVMETANLDISKYYFDQNKLKRFSGLLWAQRKKLNLVTREATPCLEGMSALQETWLLSAHQMMMITATRLVQPIYLAVIMEGLTTGGK